MRFVERVHLVDFVQSMGERLVELSVGIEAFGNDDAAVSANDLTDETFEAISRNCPNLESFRYLFEGHGVPRHSERGPSSILQNCSKL